VATAIVYFHRFFAKHDYNTYDRYWLASACLFLSSKVEEQPRKLKDVIIASHKTQHTLLRSTEPFHRLKLDSPVYENLRDKVIIYERCLMQTMNFDFTITHPYPFLNQYLQIVSHVPAENKGTVVQAAWNFANDSYETSLCLHYKPQAIASSCLYLSLKFLKLQLTATNEKPWWEPFGVDITTLEAICAKILDLYTSPAQTSKPSPSPALQSPSTSTESPAQSPSTPPPTPISPSSPGANGSVDNLHPSNDHKEPSFKTEGSRDRKYEARNNHKHPVDGRRDNYHHPNSHNRTPQSEQREDYRPRALPDAHDRRRHESDRHHAGVKRRHGSDTDSDLSHVDKKYRKTVPAISGNSSATGFSLTSRNNPTNFVSSVQ